MDKDGLIYNTTKRGGERVTVLERNGNVELRGNIPAVNRRFVIIGKGKTIKSAYDDAYAQMVVIMEKNSPRKNHYHGRESYNKDRAWGF